jgi:hypothetical protein
MRKVIYAVMLLLGLSMMSSSCSSSPESLAKKDAEAMETSYESNAPTLEDYSWIVGTWACDMGAYGTVVVKFDGNGSSGSCTEAQYGSYKTGTYNVSGNTLRYKLTGESVTTTIGIEPGHRLHAGEGYYYHKR